MVFSAVNSKNQDEQRKTKRKELLQIKPPSFVSVATDKHDQKQTGKKRVHVANMFQAIIKRNQGKSFNRNPKAGTEAETTEEQYLLTFFPWFAWPYFLYN